MKALTLFVVLGFVANLAAAPPPIFLHSIDSDKRIEVSILAVDRERETIHCLRQDGSRFVAKLSSFATADRPDIERYIGKHIVSNLKPGARDYRLRHAAAARLLALKKDPELEQRVIRALDWLQAQQNDDGSFGTEFPVAMTAFALLAYSGHGETMTSPKYGKTVSEAISYLMVVGDRNKGLLTSRRGRHVSYEHGIAAWALADALLTHRQIDEHNQSLEQMNLLLKRAMAIIVEGQTEGGGWLYSYASNGIGDLSVSIWNIYALEAATRVLSEFEGRKEAMLAAGRYLEGVAADNGGFKYRSREADTGKVSLTGHGLVGLNLTGVEFPRQRHSITLILGKPPKDDRPLPLYSMLTQAEALFRAGGKDWEQFEKLFITPVERAQKENGSWAAQNGYGVVKADGDIYATCLAALILETYYR